MAGDEMKLPMFHGNGTDDPEQYQFLCEAVWTTRQIVDNDIKKIQLVTNLMGHALDWYMRFMKIPQEIVAKKLNEIQEGIFEEFKKPKYEAQYITKLEEIKQFLNETIWDFDQQFKILMARVSLK